MVLEGGSPSCGKIIPSHGGELAVMNDEDGGTSMYFSLLAIAEG